MNVLEYLDQPQYRIQHLKEKLITKILKESMVSYDHYDDAKQEIVMSWLENSVREDYDIRSVVSFAFKIGQQSCYGHKRNMTGALKIPRRVIKEHRENGVKLVTDIVDFAIVNEVEVSDYIGSEDRSAFKLPMQKSLFLLPRRDQNIERDLNEGESIQNVLFTSGLEKRALQTRLVNLTKTDEDYATLVYEGFDDDKKNTTRQPVLF